MAKEKFFNPDKSDKTDKLKPDKRKVPIGRQVKMHEKLPAIKVENEVNWINDEIKMPFNFQEGKSTEIGVFLTPNPKGGEPIVNLNVMDDHFRSALLGKVIFEDKQGRLYRDVDIKGMGHIEKRDFRNLASGLKVEPLTPESGKPGGSQESQYGLLDRGYAKADIEASEFFVKKGLRTHRGLALIEIKEVVDENGNKISIDEAKKKGYLKKDLDPVIEVRAFGTKARVVDAKKSKDFLEDARLMVAQELGIEPDRFKFHDYFKWFSETLAKQVAIIHNAGYFHEYLTAHNVTLDCRIVDLDSVGKLPDKSEPELSTSLKSPSRLKLLSEDMDYALYYVLINLGSALYDFDQEIDIKASSRIFLENYSKSLKSSLRKEMQKKLDSSFRELG